MFADDIELVRSMVAKHGPLTDGAIVDVGGLRRPCVADYSRTIEAMKTVRSPEEVRVAQYSRYLNIENPLGFLGAYITENPETPGGLPIERLSEKYDHTIGTAILLSVLEHVDRPWEVPAHLHRAMRPGGLVIVSVPWTFPWHGSPQDHFRYSPTGLRHIFDRSRFTLLEADWRLRIPADAGVLDIHTNRPQAIESCYCVLRAGA